MNQLNTPPPPLWKSMKDSDWGLFIICVKVIDLWSFSPRGLIDHLDWPPVWQRLIIFTRWYTLATITEVSLLTGLLPCNWLMKKGKNKPHIHAGREEKRKRNKIKKKKSRVHHLGNEQKQTVKTPPKRNLETFSFSGSSFEERGSSLPQERG